MASLNFEIVESAGIVNCGQGGVTCTGQAGMTAFFEDILSGTTFTNRIFRSTDNGLTWTEPWSYVSIANPWFNQMKSSALNRILVGTEGPVNCVPGMLDDIVPLSLDAGQTWAGASGPETHFADDCVDDWVTYDFLIVTSQIILALGVYHISGTRYQLMRSTDGGATFGFPTQLAADADEARTGVVISGNTIIVGASTTGGLNSKLYTSMDAGLTWSAGVEPPGATGREPFASANLGGGVILYGEEILYRSSDSGVTWIDITAGLPGFAADATYVKYIVSPGPGVAVLVANKTVFATTTDQWWWWTTDSGATWTRATVTAPTDFTLVNVRSNQHMAVADDGAILSVQHAVNSVFQHRFRIWRGTWTDVAGLAGPCVEVEPPEPPVVGAVMGIRLDCVPILSPAPCPPLCPVDPLPAEAQLVFPSAGFGGAFRSALFVLGIVSGTGLPAQAVVAMRRPVGCGATIANNNCAVVGA